MRSTLDKPTLLLVVRWPVGGIRTFIRYTYRCPEFAKYRLCVIAADVPELTSLAGDLPDSDLAIVPCKPNWRSFYQAIRNELSRKRYALVHSHGLTSGLYTSSAVGFKRIPHLITLHDVFNKEQFVGAKGFIKHATVASALRSADMIHCVSQDVRSNLVEFFPKVNPSSLIAILNGISVQQYATGTKRDLRQELGLTAKDYLIGFFGRFMAQKGFRYLVEAMQKLNGLPSLPRRPVVLTFGWGGYIREEQEYLRSLGLTSHFYFLPFAEDIGPAIRGLDVVAMPSLWEACGLLAMEAMVAGTPLIGTNCIGLREVLADTPSTIVPPRDATALAEAIKAHILADDQLIRATQFTSVAMERFDCRKSAQSLERIYRRLLPGKH